MTSNELYLYSVDKFGQGDVLMVVKNMEIFETPGTVLELDVQEVTDIRGRASAKLNCDSGCVIG